MKRVDVIYKISLEQLIGWYVPTSLQHQALAEAMIFMRHHLKDSQDFEVSDDVKKLCIIRAIQTTRGNFNAAYLRKIAETIVLNYKINEEHAFIEYLLNWRENRDFIQSKSLFDKNESPWLSKLTTDLEHLEG